MEYYISNYIEPKLVVVAVVLYLIGEMLKSSKLTKDKYLPVILGVIGVIICGIWVASTYSVSTYKDVFTAVFTALIQGVLTAGLAVYGNQIVKQLNKKDE